MTTREEQLSAFLDGELSDAECELFTRRLADDDQLRASAFRMSLIGDAMRGDVCGQDPAGFRRAVGEAVESEGHQSTLQPPSRSRWFRPLAGGVVAASVAVFAILSLQQTDNLGGEGPAVTVPVATVGPMGDRGAYTVPETYSRQAGSPNRLSRYYLVHSENASMMGGQAPLARMVMTPADEASSSEKTTEDADKEDLVENP